MLVYRRVSFFFVVSLFVCPPPKKKHPWRRHGKEVNSRGHSLTPLMARAWVQMDAQGGGDRVR